MSLNSCDHMQACLHLLSHTKIGIRFRIITRMWLSCYWLELFVELVSFKRGVTDVFTVFLSFVLFEPSTSD